MKKILIVIVLLFAVNYGYSQTTVTPKYFNGTMAFQGNFTSIDSLGTYYSGTFDWSLFDPLTINAMFDLVSAGGTNDTVWIIPEAVVNGVYLAVDTIKVGAQGTSTSIPLPYQLTLGSYFPEVRLKIVNMKSGTAPTPNRKNKTLNFYITARANRVTPYKIPVAPY